MVNCYLGRFDAIVEQVQREELAKLRPISAHIIDEFARQIMEKVDKETLKLLLKSEIEEPK